MDATLREVLTRIGGVDRCVSEFIRVSDSLLPDRVFLRLVPELLQRGCTATGVPVRPQLLGSDPVCLAENAARLAALSPAGIDLNFGCPAKVVNRHGGGAALLAEPELLHRIVSAVRRAVPADLPVSAKMRLGLEDDHLAVDCARALVDGGAAELVVHARTKAQGYRPPAYWDRIRPLREAVRVPIVANGEIWTVADAVRCRAESGCEDLMLGRGAVADPGLPLALALHDADQPGASALDWAALQPLLRLFWQLVGERMEHRHRAGRLKQWLYLLRRRHPEAQDAYDRIRTVTDLTEIGRLMFESPAAPLAC
ncbi:tRNA-U20a,U20b-dihydrouridine synthase [Sphaerotilus hippei]|uniref:tRNA-dihydrouridine(16) synthase n=2 Tax=Sphaerotilus hippei TaxID=744406 RepID=A0A318H493_9BURK|nr:tRNA-U20a,U20b-dihydrouridine synthase [Sphaerotilus hippei]